MSSSRRQLLVLSGFAALFYFSEGLPYGVITELFPIYLRQSGVSLTRIGLLSTIGFAWTLKFLWSPLVDTVGSYRGWITAALVVITAALIPFAVADLAQSGWLWIILIILATASATQDIAVDAYTILATDASQIGVVNAVRITAYRVGIILTGGALAVVASRASWQASFAVAAGTAAVLLIASFTLPPLERHAPASRFLSDLGEWFLRPGALAVLVVTLLYRVSDAALLPMIKPFWVDRGYSAEEIGLVTTVIGVSFTIVGGVVGGFFVTRYGIFWSLVWLGVAQMLSNIGYAWAASVDAGRPLMYTAALVEPFTSGLGISAFLAFLMAICDKTRAATEYALLSGIFALTRLVTGTVSGVAAEILGYSTYFWITVFLGIPGLLLLPLIRERIPKTM